MGSASLILSNGERLRGHLIGSPRKASGELVFTTAMVGYSESLSDPSYFGQILVFSYPLIGNYGIPEASSVFPLGFESAKIHASAVIISGHSSQAFHWSSHQGLDKWLCEQNVSGLVGLDTRYLVQKIRKEGPLFAKIVPDIECEHRYIGSLDSYREDGFFNPSEHDVLREVSTEKSRVIGKGRWRVAIVDCGVKWNIIRNLLSLDCEVELVPAHSDFKKIDCHAWLISNGPGNPENTGDLIEKIRELLLQERPVLGICLGHQLLALASGAEVERMTYGHRSHNQPVRLVGTNKGYITSQNHGYVVKKESIKKPWQLWFENVNDGTVEGIRHGTKPFFSVQFHPESAGGPKDTLWIIKQFLAEI